MGPPHGCRGAPRAAAGELDHLRILRHLLFFEEAHELQVYPHGSVGYALVVVVPVDEERIREEHQALSSALYPQIGTPAWMPGVPSCPTLAGVRSGADATFETPDILPALSLRRHNASEEAKSSSASLIIE